MTTGKKLKKKQKLRNNEYYNFQEVQDNLYKQSAEGKIFTKLMQIILSYNNILLAYRNIKKNAGSKTPGTNRNTISDIGIKESELLVAYVRNRLQDFKPHSVRKRDIDKPGGGTRPLGIPTIEERLIQQCIKQVLEPICEAKFYKHSYGFRPNRSAEHAIARAMFLMNRVKLHYVVDIDVKGFFDNVNHGKLLKQLWSLGIRDKELISVISKMLKAQIEGFGVPQKGTPQGGILSPLLSGVVLNELDWWIHSQWEGVKTKFPYKHDNHKVRALSKTKLKEMYIVRYCDDFKIFCRDAKTAQAIFVAVKKWLMERLKLEMSPEKSKVVNLRKNYSNFLGFKLKVKPKVKGYVVHSHISDKAKKHILVEFDKALSQMVKRPSVENISKYNSKILGWHNYYRIATHVSADFSEIAFLVKRSLYNGTRSIRSSTGKKSEVYEKVYGKYKFKTIYVKQVALFPIAAVKTRKALNFSNKINNYNKEGRNIVHGNLVDKHSDMIRYFLQNPIKSESVEFNDNRISLYIGQNGKCGITGMPLSIGNMEIHIKEPYIDDEDKYNNLIYVRKDVHELIHATKMEIIELLRIRSRISKIGLKKINILRKLVGNFTI